MPELLTVGIKDAERDSALMASWLLRHRLVLVTGTSGNQGVAQEGALKLQEAARVTAQWDETGNVLCGPVSMLDPAWLFVGLVTRADYELHRALLKLVHHFGADRLCIAEPGLALEGSVEALMRVPQAGDPLVAPLLFLPPVQFLTYQLAVGRGLNPDEQPFAAVLLEAMLPPGREEPDWRPAAAHEGSSNEQ
jgi:glucosamine--fructose-6-phosphate aminotransferase (isomerizing)